jgi:hypothetical protein
VSGDRFWASSCSFDVEVNAVGLGTATAWERATTRKHGIGSAHLLPDLRVLARCATTSLRLVCARAAGSKSKHRCTAVYTPACHPILPLLANCGLQLCEEPASGRCRELLPLLRASPCGTVYTLWHWEGGQTQGSGGRARTVVIESRVAIRDVHEAELKLPRLRFGEFVGVRLGWVAKERHQRPPQQQRPPRRHQPHGRVGMCLRRVGKCWQVTSGGVSHCCCVESKC